MSVRAAPRLRWIPPDPRPACQASSCGPLASDQPTHAYWFCRRATAATTWSPGEPRDRARADGTSSGSRFLHGRHAGGSRRMLDQRRLRWIHQPARPSSHARPAPPVLDPPTLNHCRAETLIRGGLG
jgi:hypothetical protein